MATMTAAAAAAAATVPFPFRRGRRNLIPSSCSFSPRSVAPPPAVRSIRTAMCKRLSAMQARRRGSVAAAAGSSQFGAGENENPYEVLGVSRLDGFYRVKMAYKRRRKEAESGHDTECLMKLERAYDTIMIEQLQNRKKGVAYGSIQEVDIQQGTQDQLVWRLTGSGSYSSKSAYNTFFIGTIKFAPWRRLWKSWAPLRCKFFLWLAILNRCWTADRLAKRGLPHLAACPLCDQADESIQHLLVSCVVSRQVWFNIFQKFGLQSLVPQPDTRVFASWWYKVIKQVDKHIRKGLNSLIILVAWEVWKHRNDCVFNGASPSVDLVVRAVSEEGALWCAAGAKNLQQLVAGTL